LTVRVYLLLIEQVVERLDRRTAPLRLLAERMVLPDEGQDRARGRRSRRNQIAELQPDLEPVLLRVNEPCGDRAILT